MSTTTTTTTFFLQQQQLLELNNIFNFLVTCATALFGQRFVNLIENHIAGGSSDLR